MPESIRLTTSMNRVDVMNSPVMASPVCPGRQFWTLQRSWLPPVESHGWLRTITEEIPWQQPVIQVYGRRHAVPRLTVFLAAEGLRYRYSGTTHSGQGWPAWFEPLRHVVNEACGTSFNGCLLNLYRNGEDRMGWHADDEQEIDQSQPIASLSLGATRDFCLRHRQDPVQKETLALADGDLLIMHPGCQQQWMHGVPSRRRIKTSRVNLTFRCFLP